jgi:hypothetical protein
MTDTWGGGQWLLAFLMVGNLALPALVYGSGYMRKTGREFAAWFISKVAGTLALVSILAWGGFWS